MKSWPTNKTLYTKIQYYDIFGGDSECKYEGKEKMKMCNSDRQRQLEQLFKNGWLGNEYVCFKCHCLQYQNKVLCNYLNVSQKSIMSIRKKIYRGHRVLQILIGTREFSLTSLPLCFSFLPIQVMSWQDLAPQNLPSTPNLLPPLTPNDHSLSHKLSNLLGLLYLLRGYNTCQFTNWQVLWLSYYVLQSPYEVESVTVPLQGSS